LSLQPTDMVTSGTGPGTAIEGGGWLKPGDKAEVEVEGAGATLTNTVAKW
jgi:2-keto-4-pentenoate hydratase/2-oxohepta-3-ene-1,7-dioic acid hydratase in catechol pathway